jgi:proteic killer suppression protein
VIRSFRSKKAQALFEGTAAKAFGAIARGAYRKLKQLDAAAQLSDLAVFPGNRLEALKGDRVGQYSIRINDRYRICFEWREGHAHNVEIVDYH